MKFTDKKQDFEIPRAKLANYFFADIIMSKNMLLSFSFPSKFQSYDFELQKMTFDKIAMTYSFAHFLTLNNTYKKTGYFENYDFASDLDIGFYRIFVNNNYGKSLLDVREVDLIATKSYKLADSAGNHFVDSSGNNFVQPV